LAIYENKLCLGKQNWDYEQNIVQPKNIYITSNEKIKGGDWCLSLGVKGSDLLFKAKDIKYHKTCKKIMNCMRSIFLKLKRMISLTG
jgi:hypothetical protein